MDPYTEGYRTGKRYASIDPLGKEWKISRIHSPYRPGTQEHEAWLLGVSGALQEAIIVATGGGS